MNRTNSHFHFCCQAIKTAVWLHLLIFFWRKKLSSFVVNTIIFLIKGPIKACLWFVQFYSVIIHLVHFKMAAMDFWCCKWAIIAQFCCTFWSNEGLAYIWHLKNWLIKVNILYYNNSNKKILSSSADRAWWKLQPQMRITWDLLWPISWRKWDNHCTVYFIVRK